MRGLLHASLRISRRESGQQFRDDLGPFDACQPLVESLELDGESFVINPQTMQQSCVQIINVDGILYHVVAEVVGFPIDLASLDTTARHPHAEVSRVVIPTIVVLGQGSLRIDGSTKLTPPRRPASCRAFPVV